MNNQQNLSEAELEEYIDVLKAIETDLAGNQISKYYASPEDREAYSAHMQVFKAGAKFRERCVLGANRAGKTTLGAVECAYHATGNYPGWWEGYRFKRPVKIWAAGENIALTRDVLQQKLLGDPGQHGSGMLPAQSIIEIRRKPGIMDAVDVVRVRHVSGGVSEIGFKSFASGREDFQGVRRDFCWADEEPSSPIYSEMLLRTAATSKTELPGRTLITATPLRGLSEIVTSFLEDGRLVESDDRFACQIGWDATPHLTETEKAELIRGMSKNEIEARTLGHPSLGAGQVYTYSENDLVSGLEAIPPFWERWFAMDVGWRQTACLFFARDPDSGHVYIVDEYGGSEMEPHQHAEQIRMRCITPMGELTGAIDPASRGRSQVDGRRLIDEFRQQGLKLLPAINEVAAGIFAVQCLMSEKRLHIDPRCKRLMAELRLYQYGDDNKPRKSNDHFCDAMRYGVMTKKVQLTPRSYTRRPKVRTSFA